MAINFLNKAKEQANKQKPAGIGAGVPKVGGAPKVTPPTAPKIPGTPPMGGTKPSSHKIPGGVPPIPGGSKIPGAPKVTPPVAPKKDDIPEIEEAKETIAPLANKNPFIKKTVETKQETKQEKEIPVVEEKVEKETVKKENEIKEDKESKEEVKETVKKEEKKTTRRKKTTKKEESTTVIAEEVIIPKTEVDFEAAIAAIKSPVIDKDWNELKEKLIEEVNEISITNDMTSPAVRAVLADLDKMKSKVWLIFSEIRTIYDQLTRKEPENKIERIKRINATGSNAEERKKTGILAAMNFKDDDGKIINLYELLDEVSARHFFLKDLAIQIQSKESALITYQQTLKAQK